MAEMLLVNPRRRRKARKAPAKRHHAKRPAATRRRRRNPVSAATVVRKMRRRVVRRANPVKRRSPARRRRNPISVSGIGRKLGMSSIVAMLKDAAIGGAGAIGVDLLMGRINGFLPASLRTNPNAIGAGDAVKAGITVILGHVLSKPTRGLSRKMAAGALTVQARDLMSGFVPDALTLGRMGYVSPASIANGTNRVGPVRAGVNAYTRPGATPLLAAYTRPGASPMLSGSRGAAAREGVTQFR